MEFMQQWYRPGTDLCDVGANFGLNTLMLQSGLLAAAPGAPGL